VAPAPASTLPRFDLMTQLEPHREGLKLNELSRLLMVTGGNVTAIVDQLEKEGLVERLDEPERSRRALAHRSRDSLRACALRSVTHRQLGPVGPDSCTAP
jgi:DNA-binding MarR family transcriptional regulator